METLEETEARARAGRAIRDIGHALVGHVAGPDLIEDVARTLEGLTKRLDEGPTRHRVRENRADRWLEPVADGDRHGQLRRAAVLRSVLTRGASTSRCTATATRSRPSCTLRAAHEGAPDRSHGGIVAGLFDDVFGFVLDVVQEAAFTGELTIRYERPTPLHRPIACRGRLARRDGRKLYIEGELIDLQTDGQPVVARGRGLFIAVDPSVFDRATQQLPAPPDEGP